MIPVRYGELVVADDLFLQEFQRALNSGDGQQLVVFQHVRQTFANVVKQVIVVDLNFTARIEDKVASVLDVSRYSGQWSEVREASGI